MASSLSMEGLSQFFFFFLIIINLRFMENIQKVLVWLGFFWLFFRAISSESCLLHCEGVGGVGLSKSGFVHVVQGRFLALQILLHTAVPSEHLGMNLPAVVVSIDHKSLLLNLTNLRFTLRSNWPRWFTLGQKNNQKRL